MSLSKLDREFHYKLLDDFPSGIILFNSQGKLFFINKVVTKIIGKSLDDVKGQSYKDKIVDNEVCAKISEYVGKVFRGDEKQVNFETSIQNNQNPKKNFFLEISIIPISNGEVGNNGVVVIINDITNIREMEKQYSLEEKLADIGKFTSSITHDLRSPLQGIRMFAELIAEGSKDDIRSMAFSICDAVDQCNCYLDEIRQFIKSAQDQRIEPEKINLSDLIKSEFETYKLTNNWIKFELQIPDSKIEIKSDKELIIRILENLINNAVDSLEDNGNINLKVETSGNGQVNIELEDNGCGISKNDLKRIYEPFFTTKNSGTGLGLAIVQKCIKNIDSEVFIESQEGKGTKVKLILNSLN